MRIDEDREQRRLVINGFEMSGYLFKESHCSDCGANEAFADDYDAPFFPRTIDVSQLNTT